MKFPLQIKFKKRLIGKINSYSTTEILEFVKKDFEGSGASFVSITDNIVDVKNDFISLEFRPGLNFNRWVGVGSAKFQISKFNNDRFAVYQFDLSKLIYVFVATFIVVAIFLITKQFMLGLIILGSLGILNWLMKIFQHWICFNDTFNDFIREKIKK